jgi:hypothetical protein
MTETNADPNETDAGDNAPEEQDPESQPASDPPPGQGEEGKEHDLEFDPDQVENDPSHNPPVPELKDLKGG